MPLAQEEKNLRRSIKPDQPGLKRILLLWFLAFVFPILTGKILLTHFKSESEKVRKIDFTEKLIEESESFIRDCSIKNFISSRLAGAENHAGLQQRGTSLKLMPELQLDSEKIEKALIEGFQKELGCRPMLLICAGIDIENPSIYNDKKKFPNYHKPGKRAAKALLADMIKTHGLAHGNKSAETEKVSDLQKRLLTNFSKSLCGNFFSPLDQGEDIAEGFLDKGQGEKIFSLKRFWYSNEKNCLFAYYAIFAESSFNFDSILKQALEKSSSANITRSFELKRTSSFPFFFQGKNAELKAYRPAPFSLLRVGSHQDKDILRKLFKDGLMGKRPGQIPFLVVSIIPGETQLNFIQSIYSLLAIIAAMISILFIQDIHRQAAMNADIRTKLFISVLLTALLPGSVFFFSCSSYIDLQNRLIADEQLTLMQNKLKILELSIKSEDEFLSKKTYKLIQELNSANNAPENEIAKILERRMGGTFVGISYIRNDGLIVEKLNKTRLLSKNSLNSFELSREVVYATIYKFFKLSGLLKIEFEEKVIEAPGGKKLKAISEILSPMDIDSLCMHEGKPYSTKNGNGNFRFLPYRILQDSADPAAMASYIIIVQDVDEIIASIISKISNGWEIFHDESALGSIKTILISTFDQEATKPDFSRIWPVTEKLSLAQTLAIEKISRGKSEMALILRDKNGLPAAVTGRKFSGYPLVGISQCDLGRTEVFGEKLRSALIVLVIYFLIILSFFAGILSRLFIDPIKGLLLAARSLELGNPVFINNSIKNEFSELTNEFNSLVKGMSERERLGRFISEEAAQTIELESRQLKNLQGTRVQRSIIFCHIRDFEKQVEILSPENLIQLLNAYFSHMEAHIVQAKGQIDKYIGDAIMAGFIPSKNANFSAINACKAAIGMRNGLELLNKSLTSQGLPVICIGLGITTGLVISGKIGSYEGRQDYTIIGDKVNLAARLEALSHNFEKCSILIDQATEQFVSDTFKTEFHGEIKVKGKLNAEKTYLLKS